MMLMYCIFYHNFHIHIHIYFIFILSYDDNDVLIAIINHSILLIVFRIIKTLLNATVVIIIMFLIVIVNVRQVVSMFMESIQKRGCGSKLNYNNC
jgi:hypothetical protein